MAAYETEECRSCEARIIWASTIGGKSMPLDAEPSKDGNVQLTDRRHLGLAPLADVLPPAKQFGKTSLRKSHFATCPQAAKWRTPRKATA